LLHTNPENLHPPNQYTTNLPLKDPEVVAAVAELRAAKEAEAELRAKWEAMVGGGGTGDDDDDEGEE
jgi:hypothetical protein